VSYASPSLSLADPAGSSVLVAAVQWLQDTLLGTVATSIAAICIAWVGLLMLSGRIDLRRAASVILGCFILFGAASIAAGIRAAAGLSGPVDPPVFAAIPYVPPPPIPAPPPPPPPSNPDPYAGAAVPRR
jgi:type IV secretory pathway VirB2 component (pilin)